MIPFLEARELSLGSLGTAWRLTPAPMTFRLPAGKVTALIGRNGSGKTTLLRALLGEPVVLSGELLVGGAGARRMEPGERARAIGFVPQEHEYPPELPVEALLELAFLPRMGLFGSLPSDAKPAVRAALEQFELVSLRDRPLISLSTGERQRAFLARAVLQKPRLLALDEPTNHLDPSAVRVFWKILVDRVRVHRIELLVVTHDLEFVRTRADWVLALDRGSVRFSGSRESFLEQGVEEKLFAM